MKTSLERLIEGMIATLRTDVIPKVTDAYARGQAVGVIDLLNNIGPRIEWERAPLAAALTEKIALLHQVNALVPCPVPIELTIDAANAPSAALAIERDRLDGVITNMFAAIHKARRSDHTPQHDKALALLKQHIHDELTREMKTTRKPLFAEIASGGDKKQTR